MAKTIDVQKIHKKCEVEVKCFPEAEQVTVEINIIYRSLGDQFLEALKASGLEYAQRSCPKCIIVYTGLLMPAELANTICGFFEPGLIARKLLYVGRRDKQFEVVTEFIDNYISLEGTNLDGAVL